MRNKQKAARPRRSFLKYSAAHGRFPIAGAVILCGFWASAAYAQMDNSVLVEPIRSIEYDRGRNVSVTERARPEYDALGIRAGNMLVFPSVDLAGGGTDNVLLTANDRQSDGFAAVRPRLEVRSDWNRDRLRLTAAGDFQRYFKRSLRNQNAFDLRGLGTKEIGTALALTGELQYAQRYETPENGATDSRLAVISHYRQFFGSGRGQFTSGKARFSLAYDHVGLDFARIEGTTISQRDRDRTIDRVTAEVQYAHTSSFAFYGQTSYNAIDYSQRLLGNGSRNRDSTGFRVIGGVNFDIPGSMRGRVGVGYISREYKSALYRKAQGISAEAQVDFFVSELTTVTAGAARVVEDSSISQAGAYFDNRIILGADHELLYNLILNARAEYRHQTYKDSPQTADYFGGQVGARYLVSRFVSLNGNASYARRDVENGGEGYREARFSLGVRIQR